MMTLDLATLAVTVMLVNGLAGSAVLYVGGRERASDGLWVWGTALLVNTLQPLAFALRFAGPLVPSIVISNGLAALVLALQWEAVARFRRDLVHPPGLLGLIALPAVAAIGAALLLPYDYARNAFGSLVLCAIAAVVFRSSVRATTHDGHRTRGQHLVAGGSLLLIVLFAWRFLAIVLGTPSTTGAQPDNSLHAVTYLGTLCTMLLQTIGFVLWHQELAVLQQHELALHDPLTGCLNRRALLEECERLLRAETRRARSFAMLLFDLDYFKNVNDEYGHLVGDAVLREVADRLRAQLREGDRLARFGGEEFVMLVDDTDERGALTMAERLRASMATRPVRVGEHDIPVTMSIGVSVWAEAEPRPTIDALLAASDRALYLAKSRGRNCVELESTVPTTS